MKFLQICLLSALLVIAASNPIPADETVKSPAQTPTAAALPAEKSVPETPVAVSNAVADVPATQKSLASEDEKTEPLALPSQKEEPPKADEKKREVVSEQKKPDAQSVESKTEQVTGKSLPEQPVKDVIAEASTSKVEQPKPVESNLKSVGQEPAVLQAVSTAVPAVVADAVPSVKSDVKQAVESTVVPAVPSAIASEKKIDAEAPVPIVSENAPKAESAPVEIEPKSALPVASGQVQAAAQVQQQPQELAKERSAAESTASPSTPAPELDAASSNAEADSSSSSASSSSSEESKESKESQEKPEKKKDA